MESIEFKNIFNEIAKKNEFENSFGGWFRESAECISVLDLQKSNFGNYYELNIKIFIQGMFGCKYIKNKDLVQKDLGDVFTRQPNDYNDVFDLDTLSDREIRRKGLEELFSKFINPFTDKSLSQIGLKELSEKEQIFLLPAVKAELNNC